MFDSSKPLLLYPFALLLVMKGGARGTAVHGWVERSLEKTSALLMRSYDCQWGEGMSTGVAGL